MSTLQIILLSLFISFMAVETYWWGGATYIARPVFAGPLIGLILGDFETGLQCGAMIEMVFLGGLSMGAYSPPNSYIGGMVGTTLAIMSGGNIELGVTLSYPIGLVVQAMNYVVTNLNLIWVEKAEKAAAVPDEKKISLWHHMSIYTRMIVQYFIPTLVALLVGSDFVQQFYDSIPTLITRGLSVSAGILPAIGIASILVTLGIKKGWPYFLAGFIMSVYLNMPIMAIALSGVVLAAIIYQTSSKKADLSQLKTDQSKLEAAEKASVLTDQDLRKTFFRSFSSMGSFNFKSYNAMGYLYSIIPCLQKIYKDNPEKLRESYVRNTEFFNTHPYFKNLIIGVSLAMEEENAKNPDFDTKIISSTKTALMGPLAGIGDSVFQGTYRVLFSALGASLAIQGNPVGPWLYFIPNFLLAWGTRWWFLKGGYHSGVKLVERLKESNLFDTFVNMATIVGMMVMAAMTGSFVSLKFKPEWTYVAATETTAAKTISLQGVFDAIMPKLVPLLVVFLMYKVMKKYKGGVYWCLLGTFVVAFVGVAIGLF